MYPLIRSTDNPTDASSHCLQICASWPRRSLCVAWRLHEIESRRTRQNGSMAYGGPQHTERGSRKQAQYGCATWSVRPFGNAWHDCVT